MAKQGGDLISIALDGAAVPDGLPMFQQKDKQHEQGYFLKLHMYGIIDHGRKYMLLTYPYNVPGGGNATVHCLHRALSDRREAEPDKPFPSSLVLQLDNTVKDNKNHTVLGYCGTLVALGLFKRVVLNFMLVGHTHNDVDGSFGK